MPNTVATLPGKGTTEDRDGKVDWSYPERIEIVPNDAYCSVGADTYSDWLRASGFGFSIPPGATINGIKVEIARSAAYANMIKDSSLRLVNAAGNNCGNDKASASYWPTSVAATVYGGSTDKWGASPTPAMVNDADFGVRLSAANVDALSRKARVNWVMITVYYTAVAAPTVQTNDATSVTKDSARLNGQITDDGGEACQYRFRYKKSGGEYSYTTWAGAKTTGQTFYEDISGLDAGSLYHFNAQAKNSAGESAWGGELSFTTKGWTGKISGVTNPAKVMGVDVANIAKVKGVA